MLQESASELLKSVSISAGEDMLVILVADPGIGTDSAILENMFIPFFRSSDEFTQAQVGTGLGLAIVKKIAELHDGTVSATSKLGVGSTIRVELPRATRGLVVPDNAEAPPYEQYRMDQYVSLLTVRYPLPEPVCLIL